MVEHVLNEDNARLIQALYLEIFHNLEVTPPPTQADIANAKLYMRGRVRQILAYQGIIATPGSGLDRAIVSFCDKKIDELASGAKTTRVQREDKQDYEQKKGAGLRKAYHATGGGLLSGFARKAGHDVKTVIFSLLLLVIGIAIAAYLGNTYYLVGFVFWASYMILPNPQETKMADKSEFRLGLGSMLATRDNRANAGVSALKAICRIGIIICFVFGLYSQPFPMSNLLLLFMTFGFYFSLPVEFTPSKPYDFMLSICRLALGLFIGIYIFGAFGGGIFQSIQLGWLTIAFFCVFPVATEKESVARALGGMGRGFGESQEMVDKIIFIVIMILFAATAGLNIFGAGGLFAGTAGTVFLVVWIIGLIAGITTPAETRPWMGVIVLIVGFIVFGMGVGQQAMGTALLGEWWPTVHNTVTELFKPMGDMFTQFQGTFGQSWLLFTNPVGYAQQITQGTYATNDLGVKGAYGLEIRKFDVQSVYINEPFAIQIELENKGIFKAKNIKVEILTNISNESTPTSVFRIGDSLTTLEHMIPAYKDQYKKQWYKYTICSKNDPNCNVNKVLDDIERQDTLPIFLLGKISCSDFDETAWKDFKGRMGLIVGPTGQEHNVREYFIPFVINVTYAYEATSNLQIDFISVSEWKRLSNENNLVRGPKASIISTSPANLNLGSMDQPIREDAPFYVGFNLSTTWTKNTAIRDVTINMLLPTEFGFVVPATCTKAFTSVSSTDPNYYNLTFSLSANSSKSAFCNYKSLKSPPTTTLGVPKKTYTVIADARYTFSKWDSKDTQFNFNDVCWTTKTP